LRTRLWAAALAAATCTCGVSAAKEPAEGDKVELRKATDAFALDLYGQLAKNPGNLAFSPHSIATTLAMTYAGANGSTAAEMAKVLHLPFDAPRTHAAFAELLGDLKKDSTDAFELSTANALWVAEARLLDSYVETTKTRYGAEARKLGNASKAEAARTVNAWVAEQTHDKIKDLLKPEHIPANLGLILTNAIYMKASWSHPFDKAGTRDGAWHLAGAEKVQAKLMRGRIDRGARLASLDDLDVLELPYKGDKATMLVLLPKKVDGLAAVEKSLTPARLDEVVAALGPATVEVTLPRFKVTATAELKDVLSALGMPEAFSHTNADFSLMDGSKQLFLTAVVHKAYVSVDEAGTEAAAATAAVVGLKGMPPKATAFVADHPFVFAIRDKASGSLLFLGRVVDPR
jgi:serpin B